MMRLVQMVAAMVLASALPALAQENCADIGVNVVFCSDWSTVSAAAPEPAENGGALVRIDGAGGFSGVVRSFAEVIPRSLAADTEMLARIGMDLFADDNGITRAEALDQFEPALVSTDGDVTSIDLRWQGDLSGTAGMGIVRLQVSGPRLVWLSLSGSMTDGDLAAVLDALLQEASANMTIGPLPADEEIYPCDPLTDTIAFCTAGTPWAGTTGLADPNLGDLGLYWQAGPDFLVIVPRPDLVEFGLTGTQESHAQVLTSLLSGDPGEIVGYLQPLGEQAPAVSAASVDTTQGDGIVRVFTLITVGSMPLFVSTMQPGSSFDDPMWQNHLAALFALTEDSL